MDPNKRFDCNVKDATKDVTIHVSEKDIKFAICRDHQKCVVAKAILRQRTTANWVDVGNSVVLIGTGKKTARRYMLNSLAKEQVRFFDLNDGRFAPCTVKLKAPSTKQRLGALAGMPQGTKSSLRKNKKKKRVQPTR